MKTVVISYDAEIVTALLPFVMTAAAPEGTPPRRIGDLKKFKKNFPALPCLGEALRRVSIVPGRFS